MEKGNTVNSQECFVNTLARLRESSKTAVVSAGFTDPYTMYMHVDRPVQQKFISILESSYNSNHAELILLCGSVGDGKSHMLSYCKEKYPEMINNFYVHNDSTASLYIDKPASFTLMEIMEGFSDENIENSDSKVILAINLGTLSNFIATDTENRFKKLKEYIENAGILDENNKGLEENKYFHSVNFADYHLYEITANGIQSNYVKGLIKKIVSKDEANDYFKNYCACCMQCEAADKCPIKANYEMLSDEEIQDGIINVVVESIVKNKQIVSTRSLLNVIYEILVNEGIFERGSLEPRKKPEMMTTMQYYKSLLPNILFEKRESAEIFDAIRNVDPMNIGNELIDDFIVYYENSSDIVNVFLEDLEEYKPLLKRVEKEDFSKDAMHEVKEQILKLYIRLCWLKNRKKELLPDDEDYVEYMKAVYAFNKGKYNDLKTIYGIVEKGVLAWNGYAEKNEMQLSSFNKKTDYHMVQKIQIKKIVDNLPMNEGETLYSFKDELKLKFKYGEDIAELDVDYALLSLLKKIINGYVPSINDKRVNIKCVEFINKISKGGSKMEELYIRDMSQKNAKQYIIEYDETFGYSFEVI